MTEGSSVLAEVECLMVIVCLLQAILENNLPSEIVSKINLVDLAGR